ncbi:thioredoxin-dependent thiol peroxidase [Faecalibaculum rodentium]|uniref:thioredoxin-dependent peroxiredoxin n=2 Tax=Faecalibaculum rodentium TaxID=1702221 RepID=A0A1Q9YMA3_9FIRM|nr:thioredoxin-dependent thiol peroxidase [Faecalibaculum rodentium]OLU46143.1 peroxiredoxin [Faecalibaculum rodentium]
MLEAGTIAPDFTLEDQDGQPVTLSSFRGRPVILYFYPKDNTSGCTTQAQGYTELKPGFDAKDAVVIGISKDSPASHRRFIDKQGLDLILLSDPDHKVNELYDVWKEKSMYGKKYFGTVRSSFLISPEGVILKSGEKVKPKLDPETMLKTLDALQDTPGVPGAAGSDGDNA